jgi:multiple sugar transport system substrate-binding protein
MTRKKKCKLFVLSLISLAVILAGCGSSDKSSNPASNTSNSAQTGSGGQKSGDSEKVTDITAVIYSNYEEAMKKVVEEFEKQHPNIMVNLISSPFGQMMETIEIKMSTSSDDVDLLFVDSPLTMNYSIKGYLEPLDDLLGVDPKQVWIQSSIDAGTYKGQLVAAPLNSSSQVLYLNKDLFEANGVPLPAENERMTWEQLVEIGQKLTADTNGDGQTDIFGFSFDQVDRAYQLLPLVNSLGGQMMSDDGLKTEGYTNSPEAIQAYQFYSDLFNNYRISPKIKKEETIEYFTSGKVAMFLAANHSLPRIKSSGINFAVTLHPYFEGGQVVTPTGAWGMGISKFSKKKEAAAEFLKFLSADKQGAEIFFQIAGTLPAHLDLLNEIETDPAYDEFPNNILRIAAKESAETAVLRPKSPGYLEWETILNTTFEDIKFGTDVKKALDKAASEVDRLLKKYEGTAE